MIKQKSSTNSIDDWSRVVVDSIGRLCHDGGVRDPEGSHNLVVATRVRASAEAPNQAVASSETEVEDASILQEVPRSTAKAKVKACVRGKEMSEVITFRVLRPPDPHAK